MVTTYQARLQKFHDHIARRLLDNATRRIGNPTDCIRIRVTKNREGDVTSRIIEKADVISVVFPPLKDIPYRRLSKNKSTNRYELISLVNAASEQNKENYTITVPHSAAVIPGDLIIRIMLDEEVDSPIVICMEVTEALGTFGGQMIIQSKYNCTLYNQDLDENTLAVIAEMAKRRLELKF